MKLEIIKEEKFNENPWYILYANDSYIMGSYTLSNVENVYDRFKEKLKENPEADLKFVHRIVVKSEEIL